MSKVKYIIEVDKDDIDVFLNHINERYIINEYNGEIAVCGRVLLSAFKTAKPIEECDDCVSRQYIESKVEELENICANAPEEVLDLLADIKNAESATPKREQGEWIGDKAYPICPKCNCNIVEEYVSCSDYAEMYKPMKYCPNCGAKMR